MAQITINEVSQNYTYNIGNSAYATVALPITSCWGPGHFRSDLYVPSTSIGQTTGLEDSSELESVVWDHFRATQEGMEQFVAQYRGPESCYKAIKDYSYYHALTYLASGYDVLVCRVSCGAEASGDVIGQDASSVQFTDPVCRIRAKYPGTFGNSIFPELTRTSSFDFSTNSQKYYWNLIVYIASSSGSMSAVENLVFTFDETQATDAIPFIDDVESQFVIFQDIDYVNAKAATTLRISGNYLAGGTDTAAVDESLVEADTPTSGNVLTAAYQVVFPASVRYGSYTYDGSVMTFIPTNGMGESYLDAVRAAIFHTDPETGDNILNPGVDNNKLSLLRTREMHFSLALPVYDLLRDKLSYNANRVVSPGWDDCDINYYAGDDEYPNRFADVTPLHQTLCRTAYFSRCATALIDNPISVQRKYIYNEDSANLGYAQLLGRFRATVGADPNAPLFSTNYGFVVNWGQYQFVGTGRMVTASPSFLALMIQRSQILNQSIQYEWALPENRKHTVNIGKLQFNVPKKLLDQWQKITGVGVNVITNIPGLGTNLWGNSTAFEVPPATYQALANLSTRYLFNAVEDLVYKCGISITFAYNNDQAYSKFYAGVTPLLDTMKNVGAITGYVVKMSADIRGTDSVNANTVIGKIYLAINGVINDIVVDLVALPPTADLTQYA